MTFKIKSWFLAFAKDPLQLYNSNNSVLETQIDQNLAKIKWGILNRQPCTFATFSYFGNETECICSI